VIDSKLIEMFNYAELNYLISGTGSIDVQDWMKHTLLVGNFTNEYKRCFWEVVSEMEEE
jgi:hypothetical protein